MSKYKVTWEIDAEDVTSAEEAARFARAAQLRPDSVATVFTVTRVYESGHLGQPQVVDLTELDEARSVQERKAADYLIICDGKPDRRFSTRSAAIAFIKKHRKSRTCSVQYIPDLPREAK